MVTFKSFIKNNPLKYVIFELFKYVIFAMAVKVYLLFNFQIVKVIKKKKKKKVKIFSITSLSFLTRF